MRIFGVKKGVDWKDGVFCSIRGKEIDPFSSDITAQTPDVATYEEPSVVAVRAPSISFVSRNCKSTPDVTKNGGNDTELGSQRFTPEDWRFVCKHLGRLISVIDKIHIGEAPVYDDNDWIEKRLKAYGVRLSPLPNEGGTRDIIPIPPEPNDFMANLPA